MDCKGFKNIELRPNGCPKQFCSNVAQNTSLKLRWMWWERCGNMNLLGGQRGTRSRNCHLSRHRSQGQDDLWSVNFQSSPVQCGRVQRWWTRSRCCFMTPYVAATKLLSTSSWQLLSASRIWPSWLMLLDTANVDTSNLDSLLMWILLIILMWPVS